MSDPEQQEARLAHLERRLKQLEHNQRALDVHIAALENSIVFRILRRVGRPLLDAKTKAGQWLLHSPFHGLYLRLFPPGPDPYTIWAEQRVGEKLPELAATPRFTLLLPVYKPRREWLEEAIGSVRAQSYVHWELAVCNDASPEPWVSEYLTAVAAAEPRIRITHQDRNLGIAGALNQTSRLATGDYLAFLDQDDRLAPDALHWLAAAAPADLIYSDEDRLDEGGRRVEPVFKPDWSPDLLLSCMYMGHLMAISRSAWDLVGRSFRSEYDGAQDYDLALRITDRPVAVHHVPRALYHWRRHTGSTAADPAAKPYAHVAGRRALADALHRRGAIAEVEDGPRAHLYQVRWKPRQAPLASLVICSRSSRLLEQCLTAIAAHTGYSRREVIVVQHLGHDDVALQAVIERHQVRSVPYSGLFHFSRMNNLGAQASAGEVLVFVNDDIEPLEPSWLERLVAQVERPDVGIAGARLLYPSGTLQHAGVTIGISDGCGHIGRGMFCASYWPWLELTRDVAAVTGACLAARAELFHRLGGFAEEFPVNYNDTDLCLRARRAGYRVVYDAGAVLRHHECKTRRGGVSFRERALWYERWADVLDEGDPFYSQHLTREREDLSLRLEGP